MSRLGILAWAALAACGSAPAATIEFFGPTIEPPRGLTKIQPGMSVADAKRLVPELREPARKGVRDELVLDTGTSNITLAVRVDAGTVSSIVAIVQGRDAARELLTRAWGEPSISRDSLGQPETTWASEASGWKVKLDCIERNCLVEYVPYHVLASEFFGAHVVPPGPLGKLKIGMKLADARAIAPGVVDVRAGIATGVDGVREFVAIDDKLGTVRAIYLNLPKDAEKLIEDAWSEGWHATEPVGKHVLVWPDPTTRWRATLRDALGYSHDLAYDNYLPAADLLGDQPDRIDALPEPVLGKTLDEVKRAYKDSAEVEVVTTGKEHFLVLQPTEWERFSTRIQLVFAGGRVAKLEFAIPFKPHPEARDTLLELFTHKWGVPREGEARPGNAGKPTLVFHDDDPHVECVEDVEHGAWRFEIR
ncbi:MAG: hypothetical protein NT062_05165 [Proteobacteria bacterium]|nr:hypothetical protein [Pseudomonadota bacterium]